MQVVRVGTPPCALEAKGVSSRKTDPASFYLEQQRVLLRLALAREFCGVPLGSRAQREVTVSLGAFQTPYQPC